MNFFCTLLVGCEIVFFVFPESLKNEHYGYQHIYLIPLILIGILIDLAFQKAVKKYSRLLLFETLFMVTVALLNTEF